MSKKNEPAYAQHGGIVGALSPHETDFSYLSDMSGDNELKFARSKDMAVDTTMTNFVRVYKFEEQQFAGDIIMPRRPVSSKIGRWKNRGQEAVDIHVSDLLSDRGKANEIGFAVSESTYLIDPHGLVAFCSDEEIEENGAVQCAMEATIILKAAAALRQEIRIRNIADATSFTITTGGGTDWDVSTTINADVAASKADMKSRLGFGPSHFVLGDHIVDEVVGNTAIKNDIVAASALLDGRKYLGLMTADDLGATTKPWGLQLVTGGSMYNSAAPGLTRVLARVWADDGYMFRVDRETRSMTWGMQFELLPETIVRWREENPGGWYYKLVYKRVAKEVTPEAVLKLLDLT